MRFFFDRNMSPYLARMIAVYDRVHTVVHHDADGRFCPTTPDTEWIKALGNDDPTWLVLSADGRILKNKAERAALVETRLTFFCMGKAWSHMGVHEYSWKFLKLWPEIVFHSQGPARRIFEVAGAKIDLVMTHPR